MKEKAKLNVLDTLIEALSIGKKYMLDSTSFPIHCDHNEFWLCVEPMLVNDADRERLEELGFTIGNGAFIYYE